MKKKIVGLLLIASFSLQAMEDMRIRQLESAIQDREVENAKNVINAGVSISNELLEKAKKKSEEKKLFGGTYPDSIAIFEYVKKGKVANLVQQMIIEMKKASENPKEQFKKKGYGTAAAFITEINDFAQANSLGVVNLKDSPFREVKELKAIMTFFMNTKFSVEESKVLEPIFAYLIDSGIGFDDDDDTFKLFIAMATKEKEPFLTTLLKQKGASYVINNTLPNGDTLLHQILKNNLSFDLINKIIAIAPNLINIANNNNETPLYLAVSSNNTLAVDILLFKGGIVDEKIVTAAQGKSINQTIKQAIEKFQIEKTQEQEKAEKEKAEKQQAEEKESFVKIQKFIENILQLSKSSSIENVDKELTAFTTYYNKYGKYIRLNAFKDAFNAIILTLLAQDQSKIDQNTLTKVILTLIDYGADGQAVKEKKNILHYAVANQQITLLKSILEKLSSETIKQLINHQDEMGNTPLHEAALGYYNMEILGGFKVPFTGTLDEKNTRLVIELLIKNGADKNIVNKKDKKPADLTQEIYIKEMIDPELKKIKEEEQEKLAKEREREEQQKKELKEKEEKVQKEAEESKKKEAEKLEREKEEKEEQEKLAKEREREENEAKQRLEEEKRAREEQELAKKEKQEKEAGKTLQVIATTLEQLTLSINELQSQIANYKK